MAESLLSLAEFNVVVEHLLLGARKRQGCGARDNLEAQEPFSGSQQKGGRRKISAQVPTSPQTTKHNNSYPAIDPEKPELSQAGKTVVITGAGSDIVRQTAIAFATANAKHVVLIGRTKSALIETRKHAGRGDDHQCSTNVKSIVIATQAFLPTATSTGAAVYALAASALMLPAKVTAYLSRYLSSKVAQAKVIEYLAIENLNIFACSVHPGMVDTKIFRGSGATLEQLPMDTITLPANFLVWLSQKKTKFLNGNMVWAN
ncbi:NAD(P)-binding protein [Sporormia fimetaria CBS 119925]|uniref:NAD(P)-binding protein n=1 Tax=Sporormia fimetaria CBS 119925 TaxID=1340428 RepID=A0A6A6UX67_9PLEO|nr:NAD(P)-binding protein [Sporormia fimetaria CBS 119925]